MHSGPRDGVFRTLRFRLTFWNGLVILLLMVLFAIGVREGMRFTLLTELDRLLDEDVVEVKLAVNRFSPDWNMITGMLERKALSHSDRDWFCRICDEKGNTLAASPGTSLVGMSPTISPRAATVDGRRIHDRIIELPNGNRNLVRVGSSMDGVTGDVDRLSRMLWAAIIVAVIVSPLFGYWLAGRATRPLRDIIQTTSRLHPQQLDERLPIRGTGDEIDQLSTTINQSLDRIADYIDRQRVFVAHAAHELRSPLTGIRAAIEVSLQHDRPNEEYRELLADLAEQTEGLTSLTNRLLLLAETEAGPQGCGADIVSLNHVVTRAAEMFQGVAEQRGVDLRTDQQGVVAVFGDGQRLRQVANNLIDNALKFTPAGGRVIVSVLATDHRGVLEVRDTGPGISSDDLPMVFDRFFRGQRQKSGEKQVGGVGLGLSICRTIVEMHGGQITLTSQPGKGTVARVELPVATRS